MQVIFLFLLLVSLVEAQTRTQIHMNTFVSISIDDRRSLTNDGFNIISDIEDTLSSYSEKAKVYKLNKYKYVKNNHYLYESLLLAQKYYKQSNGYFNIAIGTLTKDTYHFGENLKYIHYNNNLQTSKIDFNGISINKEETYLKKNIKLDFGGMGKGYAVDKVVEYFRNKGVSKAIISASGDIACLDQCTFAVQNPFDAGNVFKLTTKKAFTSISTSGNYQRFIKHKNNNHLLNPYTKSSQKDFASITLISNISNADLDAYTTAASVMPKIKALQFLKDLKIAYIIITNSKNIIISDNIEEYVNLPSKYTLGKKKGYIKYQGY